jgi:hypothetical protein
MKTVFVDTSGFYACLDRMDSFLHRQQGAAGGALIFLPGICHSFP